MATNTNGIEIDPTLTRDELKVQFDAARAAVKSATTPEERVEARRLTVALSRRISEITTPPKGRGFASRAGQRQYNERKAYEGRR